MNAAAARSALLRARALQEAVRNATCPHSEVTAPSDQPVLPHSMFTDTRGYIVRVVHQINRCYTTTAYDGCAVMIRRLLETLIIEAFERKGIDAKIKGASGDFLHLGDMIPVVLAETGWNLSRSTKAALPRLKDVGDKSAHNRRYNAKRQYIDELIIDLRVVAEELLYVAGLKK
jgi:hypothetical protein